MLFWSSVVEPLLWAAGLFAFVSGVRLMLLNYVLDTLGGPRAPRPESSFRRSRGFRGAALFRLQALIKAGSSDNRHSGSASEDGGRGYAYA